MAQYYMIVMFEGRAGLEDPKKARGTECRRTFSKLHLPSRNSSPCHEGEIWEGVVEHDTQPGNPRRGVVFVRLTQRVDLTPWFVFVSTETGMVWVESWVLPDGTRLPSYLLQLKPKAEEVEKAKAAFAPQFAAVQEKVRELLGQEEAFKAAFIAEHLEIATEAANWPAGKLFLGELYRRGYGKRIRQSAAEVEGDRGEISASYPFVVIQFTAGGMWREIRVPVTDHDERSGS